MTTLIPPVYFFLHKRIHTLANYAEYNQCDKYCSDYCPHTHNHYSPFCNIIIIMFSHSFKVENYAYKNNAHKQAHSPNFK